jgi:23S rRNA (guanosine2251-2'-O)-methyltransferase
MTDKIYGRKPLLEMLRSGSRAVHHIHLLNGAKDDTVYLIEEQARAQNISVSYDSRHKLDSLAGNDHHQGVVAICDSYKYAGFRDLLKEAEKRDEPLFAVVLDELEDPQNLGAILRSVEAAGAHGVLVPRDRATGVTPTVVKVSAGAADHVLIAQESNLNEALRKMKEAGAWVVGTDADAETDFYQHDFTGPTVIVMGSEGKGLRRLIRENCDTLVKIPMYGQVSSLNVSVSTALLLFEVVRQRRWMKPKEKNQTVSNSYLNDSSWASPPRDKSDAPLVNEFYASTRPASETPPPVLPPPGGRDFFVQALLRTLKRRMRALQRCSTKARLTVLAMI